LILSIGCHFLVQVKGNCRQLLQDIRLFTALTQGFSSCEYFENTHGYPIYRRVELFENKIQLPKAWNGIKRFVKVRRWGHRNGKRFETVSFYVLSKELNSAYQLAKAIQGHWCVENNLHWVKDVNMGEDDMSVKEPKMASILAYFNNVAINVLNKSGYKPTKDTFAKFSNKVNELYKLF